jgi:hydrogenase expression/formation protein HypE
VTRPDESGTESAGGPAGAGDAPERILLSHGSGGRLTQELVRDLFAPAFANPHLAPLSDAALLPELPSGARPVLTTDAFVVDPPVFPGGDLGYLSVCGTVNDLAVAGARPAFLTWALILEEGADGGFVAACTRGAARAAGEAGVAIVAGDTKVVPRGKGDRLYITTAGLGILPPGRNVGDECIRPGDVLIVSGPIGDHGATIMAARHDLSGRGLTSDVAPLGGMTEALFGAGVALRAMHDPTRGGVVTTCHEVARRSGLRLLLHEPGVPVRDEVRAVCELLGLDPLAVPCEGRALIWVAPEDAERALEVLHGRPEGRGAAAIGTAEAAARGRAPVTLRNAFGAERPLDLLSGADLPRIC